MPKTVATAFRFGINSLCQRLFRSRTFAESHSPFATQGSHAVHRKVSSWSNISIHRCSPVPGVIYGLGVTALVGRKVK